MQRKRILYVDHSSVPGGAEHSLYLLLKYIDREKFQPLLVLPDQGDLFQRVQGLDIQTSILSSQEFNPKRGLSFLRTVWGLRAIALRTRADLIHANSLYCGRFACWSARLAGIPSVVHIRDVISFDRIRRWFLNPTMLIANSRGVKEHLVHYGFPRRKICVIHNGVDLEQFSVGDDNKSQAKAVFGVQGKRVIVIAAQLNPLKRHDLLLEAMASLLPALPDLHLLVAGKELADTGGLTEKLHALASRLGVQENVSWLGYQEDMKKVYLAADICVLPSDMESFGRVLIEAMSMQLPVIATRVGGIPDVVLEEETGLLVPPGDSAALAMAISRLLEDQACRLRLARAGRDRAVKCFSIHKNVEATQRLYDELMNRS